MTTVMTPDDFKPKSRAKQRAIYVASLVGFALLPLVVKVGKDYSVNTVVAKQELGFVLKRHPEEPDGKTALKHEIIKIMNDGGIPSPLVRGMTFVWYTNYSYATTKRDSREYRPEWADTSFVFYNNIGELVIERQIGYKLATHLPDAWLQWHKQITDEQFAPYYNQEVDNFWDYTLNGEESKANPFFGCLSDIVNEGEVYNPIPLAPLSIHSEQYQRFFAETFAKYYQFGEIFLGLKREEREREKIGAFLNMYKPFFSKLEHELMPDGAVPIQDSDITLVVLGGGISEIPGQTYATVGYYFQKLFDQNKEMIPLP